MPSVANRRVLVTRAAGQGSSLADALRALGAEPVLIPAIETVEPASFAVLDGALSKLGTFQWLLFTSANAVEAFVRRHRALHSPLPQAEARSGISVPPGVRIAAIGPATASALQTVGLPPNLLPPQAVAESLTAALLPYVSQADGTPTRFLLVRAAEAREYLPEALRAAGAHVTIAPAYRTVIPARSVDLLRDLLQDPARSPTAITFTSSSTARNLLALCDAARVTLPGQALRVSIGPVTSATLCELGFPPHAEAPEATVASLAAAVMRALAGHPAP